MLGLGSHSVRAPNPKVGGDGLSRVKLRALRLWVGRLFMSHSPMWWKRRSSWPPALCVRQYFDGLDDRAHFQPKRQLRLLPHVEDDFFGQSWPKAVCCNVHRVPPRPQADETVGALLISFHCSVESGVQTLNPTFSSRHYIRGSGPSPIHAIPRWFL